jgi:predicted nucleotidyltransferase
MVIIKNLFWRKRTMHIELRHRYIVEKILKENGPDIEVRAFGSRVKGTHNMYSDLPYKVDILDYCRIDESTKKITNKNYEVI